MLNSGLALLARNPVALASLRLVAGSVVWGAMRGLIERVRRGSSRAVLITLHRVWQSACVQAEWSRKRIKPGMTVAEVFQTLRGWGACSGHSLPVTQESGIFSAVRDEGTYRVFVHGEFRQVDSKEELIQAAEKQMNKGRSSDIEFTYFGSPRAGFRVDFDSHGKVEAVSEGIRGPG